MPALQSLETSLNDLFVKRAPPLGRSAKKALVEYLPWVNLALGLLALYTVYALWHWAHLVSSLLNYSDTLNGTYSLGVRNRLDFGIWIGLFVLIVEAVLYIAAFSGTRDRKKSGWNLMFYALLVNIAYGVVILFTDYGSFGNLVITLLASAAGLYLLFQIRSSYGKSSSNKKT